MSKGRLAPDPCVGVADWQKVFSGWLKEEGSWDLWKLVKAERDHDWKTAPDASWLSQLYGFFKKALRTAPNCTFASSKLKMCLEKMQKSEHRLNYSRMPDSQFHDKVDFQLRVAASQLRTLKTNSTQLTRCLRKASREEGQALEELLAMISLPDEKEETKTVEKEEEKKTPVTETAMVVYEPPQEDKSPLKIFSRILAQKNSGDSEQGEPTSANRSASSSTGTSRPHLVRQNDMLPFPTATASPKRILKRQNAFVSFSKAESCWLAEILSKSIEDCNVCTSNIL